MSVLTPTQTTQQVVPQLLSYCICSCCRLDDSKLYLQSNLEYSDKSGFRVVPRTWQSRKVAIELYRVPSFTKPGN
jgi:hypothetical protein